MNKKPLIFIVFLLLMTSLASAEVFNISETRPRIFLDNNFDKMVWTGVDDLYVFKGGSATYYRAQNNFTSFPSFTAGAGDFADYFALLYNNSGLMRNGLAPTLPSTQVTVLNSAPTTINVRELNIFGVNDFTGSTQLDLNPITPLPYNLVGIEGISFDQNNNLLYVLHNTTKDVNVYDVFKNTNPFYEVDYVRTFTLNSSCGYTHPKRIDFEVFGDHLYLLCGWKNQAIDRTIYSYNLAGDFTNQYNLIAPDNEYISITVSPSTNELVIYDDTDDELAFFNFTGGGNPIAGGVVLANGDLYNTSNICVNDFQLCNNATVEVDMFGFVVTTCNDQNSISWCSAGCINVKDGNDVFQGVCQQNACTNECNNPYVPYNQVCETPNTFATCTIGGDNCLDLNSGLFCNLGEVCDVDPIQGDQCILSPPTESGLYTTNFISVDIKVNNTNAYEVIQQDIDKVIPVITAPTSTIFGLGVQAIQGLFLKSFAETIYQEVKINGVQDLVNTEYYSLSCDFTSNLLEEDYLESVNDLSSGNIITTNNDTSYIDINTNTTKTFEVSSLGSRIEYIIKPIGSGTNYIRFMDGAYSVLELGIQYDNVTNTLLIRDTGFNKLLANETAVAGVDSLDYIAIKHLFIAQSDVNNVQIGVFREVNNIPTQQYYYSRPISYYSTNAVAPKNMKIYNTDDSTLRLYQVIQFEESGYAPYNQGEIGECEFTSLTCKNQRAWVNNINQKTYYFYEDLQTCVSELNGVISGNPQTSPTGEIGEGNYIEGVLGDLNEEAQVLISVIAIFLTLGIGGFLYSESRDKFVLGASVVISGLWLFYFTFIGFLPVWIVVTLGIVAVGFVVRLGVNTFAR